MVTPLATPQNSPQPAHSAPLTHSLRTVRPWGNYYQNKMGAGQYLLSMPYGDMSDRPEFTPYYSPKVMLQMGVFEGCYLNSSRDEYPEDWFTNAKLSDVPDAKLNFFGIKSRLPKGWWDEKGLINSQDPRGWFEWYCRFYMGRRTEDDTRQIKRHRAFARHNAQVLKNGNGDLTVRPKQRQALLQWSWNVVPDQPTNCIAT